MAKPGGKRLDGTRKAAIVTVLLGPEVAGQLVPFLTPRHVARLAREVAELGLVEHTTAEKVLNDYFKAALEPRPEQGGPDLARQLLQTAQLPEEQMEHLLGSQEETSAEDILGTLLEARPETLAAALQSEHPQTVALILMHMTPSRAALLLQHLPEAVRSEAVLRLATLREVQGEVIGEVAQSLNDRLTFAGARPARDGINGFELAADVLRRMPRMQIRQVLEELEPDHPQEVGELRGEVFTFDSLLRADDRGIQEMLRQVDTSRLGLALHGADDEVRDKILGNLSERAANMLAEEMEFLGNVKTEDREAAQRELIDLALQLEDEGKLVFVEDEDEE